MTFFTLELLHFSDQEANAATIGNIPNLSGVLNALRGEDLGDDGVADNTLTLSSGDVIIPGLFFDASEAVFGSPGIADIQIQNELGVQAISFGNHEFDLGTGLLAGLIDGSADGGFSALVGSSLEFEDFDGADFPYLAANLIYATDPNLAPLEVAGGLAPQPNAVSSSTVIDVNGELIGVVGAVVPTIGSISSPGDDLGVLPEEFDGGPAPAQLDALAAILQAEVDALLLANPTLNKVVLLSHMQRLEIELGLAERLENVDIIVAGGSNTRLFDEDDRPRDGDGIQGGYPQFVTNAGGTTTAVVNTDANYKYVGRLVLDFDADGNVIADSYDAAVSGAFATDDQGVADLGAEGLIDPEVQAIADAIQERIVATEGNVFGVSEVFLNGNRSGAFDPDDPDGVRTQETNLGNLTADANLAYANQMVEDLGLDGGPVLVSIKNGGGIRASIGQIVVPAGGAEAVRLPNEEIRDAEGAVVKPAGGISQNDIATTLAFNNGLTLLTLTKAELVGYLEEELGPLDSEAGTGVSGGFPQLSGLIVAFDDRSPAGDRVIAAAIVDDEGDPIAELVRDGEIVGDPSETFRVVTLNFLANGGSAALDSALLSDPQRIDLLDVADDEDTGAADFAPEGSEQDALAEYLAENHPDADNAYDEADGGPFADLRIQNVSYGSPDAPDATDDFGRISIAAVLDSGVGEGGAEVVVHEDGRLYVTNGELGRIDVWDIETEALVDVYDLTGLPGFDGVQSVAVKNGLVAVAVSTPDVETTKLGETVLEGQPGYVALIDAETGDLIDRVTVGNLPDMVTFSEDGQKILVANEGEFTGESDLDRDPIGSVSIIDVSDLLSPTAVEVTFEAFDGLEDLAREKGIRLNDGASLLRGLEPEYITVSGDTAYVSLQEANAIGVLDLATGAFVDVFSLGVVDHSVEGFELDPNDDGKIGMSTFDDLVGLRMPDAIDSFTFNGQTYLITANEGDGRGDPTDDLEDVPNPQRGDEARVGDILDGEVPGVSIDASVDTTGLERLTVSLIDGDTDGDGDIDVLHAFGSRSFTIFDTDGNVVFDSGSQFEAIIADLAGFRFNNDDGDPILLEGDNRSDAKGPEPEAVTVGEIDGDLYAFIGLERDSGVMIYNITDPGNARFVDYITGFGNALGEGAEDFVGPETIAFISAEESSTGNAQIAVAYEVSGNTVVYDFDPITPIYKIQGAGHVSLYDGRTVETEGVVTAVAFNGFYLQDEEGDGDDATSDGIFVFTGSRGAKPAVGDAIEITGDVSEFIPGGAGAGNLSTTQLTNVDFEVISSGNALPDAVILGEAGRRQSDSMVISPEETPVNLQNAGDDAENDFNPEVDAIDFFESLEGMRVTIDDPVAVSGTRVFGGFSAEVFTVADDGENASGRGGGLNDRGGINLNADADGYGDLNPERIQIQFDPTVSGGASTPRIQVGDALEDVTGVVGYSFGNYEVIATSQVAFRSGGLRTEFTEIEGDDDVMTFATYNVLNLTSSIAVEDGVEDPDAAQREKLADQIVRNLGAPDVIALQEIQDNDGVQGGEDNALVTDATQTLQDLVDAIALAGGPTYAFFDVFDAADASEFTSVQGGVPGGNIRNAFLYNPERVDFVSMDALTPTELAARGASDPDAFEGSRVPLIGTFSFNGEDVTIINNHMSSRFGSTPVFGGPQPFTQAGEAERAAQAQANNEVVDGILADDPDANVVVAGDLNTFEFTDELAQILPGVGDEQVLNNLIEEVETDDAYSFIFDGNSQALDHIFATDGLLQGVEVDYVHLNVDFARDDDGDQFDGRVTASDHEPIVAAFDFGADAFEMVDEGNAPRTADDDAETTDVAAGPAAPEVRRTIEPTAPQPPEDDVNEIIGTGRNDRLRGSKHDDYVDGMGGRKDRILLGRKDNGEDVVDLSSAQEDGKRSKVVIRGFDETDDLVFHEDTERMRVVDRGEHVRIVVRTEDERDVVRLRKYELDEGRLEDGLSSQGLDDVDLIFV